MAIHVEVAARFVPFIRPLQRLAVYFIADHGGFVERAHVVREVAVAVVFVR